MTNSLSKYFKRILSVALAIILVITTTAVSKNGWLKASEDQEEVVMQEQSEPTTEVVDIGDGTDSTTSSEQVNNNVNMQEEPSEEEGEEATSSHFVYEDSNVVINADILDGDLLPERAILVAKIIEEDVLEDKQQFEFAENELEKYEEKHDINFDSFIMYDIHFEVDGKEIEPQGNVKVSFDYKNPADLGVESTDDSVRILHVDESTGKAKVKDVTRNTDTNSNGDIEAFDFVTDSFSTFIVANEGLSSFNLTLQFVDSNNNPIPNLNKTIYAKISEANNDGNHVFKTINLVNGKATVTIDKLYDQNGAFLKNISSGTYKITLANSKSGSKVDIKDNDALNKWDTNNVFIEIDNNALFDAQYKLSFNDSYTVNNRNKTVTISAVQLGNTSTSFNTIDEFLKTASQFMVVANKFTQNDHLEGNIAVNKFIPAGSASGINGTEKPVDLTITINKICKPAKANENFKFAIYDARGNKVSSDLTIKTDSNGKGSVSYTIKDAQDSYMVYELDGNRKINNSEKYHDYTVSYKSSQGIQGKTGIGGLVINYGATSFAKVIEGKTSLIANKSTTLVTTTNGITFQNGTVMTVTEDEFDALINVQNVLNNVQSLATSLATAKTSDSAVVYYLDINHLPVDNGGHIELPGIGTNQALVMNVIIPKGTKKYILGHDFNQLKIGNEELTISGYETSDAAKLANRTVWNFIYDDGSLYDGTIKQQISIAGSYLLPLGTLYVANSTPVGAYANEVIQNPGHSEIHEGGFNKDGRIQDKADVKVINGKEGAGTTTSVSFTADKVLEGKTLTEGKFLFKLKDSNGTTIQTKTNNAQGKISFDQITYDKTGTYNYTISEVVPQDKKGITYDTKVVNVKVVVTTNEDEDLVATVTYDDLENTPTFTNTYKAEKTSASFECNKVLEGKTLAEGQFAFNLKDTSGNVLQTKNNSANGNVKFDALEYTEAGTYSYTISEVVPQDKNGITYDSKAINVVVEVTDNGEGQLVASVKYNGNENPSSFTNSYEAKGETTIGGKKLLTDLSGTGRTIKDFANKFAFNLVEVEPSGGSYVPVEGGVSKTTSTIDNNGEFKFDKIEYLLNKDHSDLGTHFYKVNETKGQDPRITYALKDVIVRVTVTDNGNGALNVTQSIISGTDSNFTNLYQAAEIKVSLEANKVLSGKTLKADMFTFILTDKDGKKLAEVNNDNEGKAIFPELSYNKVGTYEYFIKEKIPTGADPIKNNGQVIGYTLNGTSYDTTIHKVVVNVSANSYGNLVPTVRYDDETTAPTFTNAYKAEKTSARFEVGKALTGRTLKNQQFTFELIDSTGEVLQTKKNDADGKITFDAIEYTKADTYTYGIREVNDEKPGYSYDSNVISVVVTVTDNGEGQLNAVVKYDGKNTASFTNSYSAKEVSVGFNARKDLSGRDLEADQFTFKLKGKDGKEVDTKKNDVSGNVSFDPITYDKIGTYEYTITEVDDKKPGYTYSDKEVKVKVVVEDNGTGALSAKVTYDGNEDVETFANTYTTKATSTELTAKKTLTGIKLESEQFTFNLKDKDAKVIDTKKNDKDGDVKFDSITYNKAGSYRYTIEEVIPSKAESIEKNGQVVGYILDGITYDTTVHNVIVKVIDNGKGELEVESIKYDDETTAPTFTNTYEAKDTSIKLEASKDLTGRDLKAGEFTFELSEGNKVLQTKQNAADGKVAFAEIKYTEVGTHNYTIKEVIPEDTKGITYDRHVEQVTVTVTDNGKGQLVAKAEYKGEDGAVFANEYKAEKTSVELATSKVLTGRNLNDKEFTFELNDKTTGKTIQSKVNNIDGSVKFDKIIYDAARTYNYTISEVIPKGATEVKDDDGNVVAYTYKGVTYDTSVYNVRVEVVDNGVGQLESTVTYDGDKAPVFTNTYKADSAKVNLKTTKKLDGQNLKNEQFSFELIDENNNVVETKKNALDGSVSFKTIEYTKPDTYKYTIKEVIPEGAKEIIKDGKVIGYVHNGITYDVTVHNVEIEVKDNLEGKLIYTVKYDDGEQIPVFNNSYEAKGTSTSLVAKKSLVGKTLKDKQFLFELRDDSGKLITTANNDADGNVKFDAVTYTEAKTYNYTIKEVIPEGIKDATLDGITYDTSSHSVKVVVTDDGLGALHVTSIKYDNQDDKSYVPTFTNTYNADSTEATFVANKVLTGLDIKPGQFDFELKKIGDDESSELIEKISNGENGNVTFNTIKFDKVGEYNYTINEVIPESKDTKGISYDDHVVNVKVVVTDDEKGSLEASVTYDDKVTVPTFTNTYKAEAASVSFSAIKKLTGKDIQEGQFNFELKDGNKVLQTVSNKEDGSVQFNPIEYTEVGTYNYTISEVNGKAKGYTYDLTPVNVTVNVTDNKEGKLVASVTYNRSKDIPVFTNEYTADGSIKLEGTKKLVDLAGSGKKLDNYVDKFKFNLIEVEPLDESYVPVEGGVSYSTNKLNKDGTFAFDEISYNLNEDKNDVGDHYYEVSEETGDEQGITYSTKKAIVMVNVEDNGDGTLKVTPSVIEGSDFTFTNKYDEINTVIKGSKVLVDDKGNVIKPSDWSGWAEFNFNLYDLDGNKVSKSAADSTGKFEISTPTYYETGTYDYIVKEVIPSNAIEVKDGNKVIGYELNGITYPVKEIKVSVVVSTDESGKLVASVNSDEDISFTNTYKASGSINFFGYKVLKGERYIIDENHKLIPCPVKDGEFSFTLTETDKTFENKVKGGIEQTVDVINVTDEEGNVTPEFNFDEIKFNKAGTYYYTVKEEKCSDKSITYDDNIYKVTVEVIDNHDGTFKVESDAGMAGLTFTNEYNNCSLTIKKNFVFNGKELTDEQKERIGFKIEGPDSFVKVVSYKSFDEDGTYTLVDVKPGEYKVTESNQEFDGYKCITTYDTDEEECAIVNLEKGTISNTEITNTYYELVDFTITKNIDKYEVQEGLQEVEPLNFVFGIESTLDIDGDGISENVFSNVYSALFSAAGSQVIKVSGIPYGAKVVITELNKSETYEVDTLTQELVLDATDLNVTFNNYYQGKNEREHGAVNTFKHELLGWTGRREDLDPDFGNSEEE